MFSGWFSKPNVKIIINEVPKRKKAKVYDKEDQISILPYFKDKEDISGKVMLNIDTGTSFDHQGLRIEMIGFIESVKEKNDKVIFVHVTHEIEMTGNLNKKEYSWPFIYSNAQLPYETFQGKIRNIKYIIKVAIDTSFKTLTWEKEFAVRKYETLSVIPLNNPFKLEIGVEDWLLLFFEFKQMDFGLKDIILGTVTFKNVSIKLTTLELHILRKEISLSDNQNHIETITNYQLMDGDPINNETIIIRFPLKQVHLSPSYQNINNNKFSVQYFMSIVLIDNDERKYTKQYEIFMHRIDKHMKDDVI